MKKKIKGRLTRHDWIQAALEVLDAKGVDGVRIVTIAKSMNVTSGSFYWHFKGHRDLLNCLLEYWEQDMTDLVIEGARSSTGPPDERVLTLMVQVIEKDASRYDHAVSVWAKNDPLARQVYKRVLRKRFDFARWMFEQSGFTESEASVRGRLLVTYMMGESSTDVRKDPEWKAAIGQIHSVLIGRSDVPARIA